MESCNHSHIHGELVVLLEKQIDALERDTFVGLSADDVTEFEDRHRRIRELQEQLLTRQDAA
jgi:hypothetical protein